MCDDDEASWARMVILSWDRMMKRASLLRRCVDAAFCLEQPSRWLDGRGGMIWTGGDGGRSTALVVVYKRPGATPNCGPTVEHLVKVGDVGVASFW